MFNHELHKLLLRTNNDTHKGRHPQSVHCSRLHDRKLILLLLRQDIQLALDITGNDPVKITRMVVAMHRSIVQTSSDLGHDPHTDVHCYSGMKLDPHKKGSKPSVPCSWVWGRRDAVSSRKSCCARHDMRGGGPHPCADLPALLPAHSEAGHLRLVS